MPPQQDNDNNEQEIVDEGQENNEAESNSTNKGILLRCKIFLSNF